MCLCLLFSFTSKELCTEILHFVVCASFNVIKITERWINNTCKCKLLSDAYLSQNFDGLFILQSEK